MQTIKTHITDLKPGDKILAPDEKGRNIWNPSDQLTVRHVKAKTNEVLIMESGGISLVASHFEKVVPEPAKSKAVRSENNQLTFF